MLSNKDKKWIKNTIKDAVTEALTVEWELEKVRDEKTGQPLARTEKIKEKVFIPSVFIQLLSFYEGAVRGMQEDVNKHTSKIDDMDEKIKILGQIMFETENSLKCLAAISDRIKQLNFPEVKQIESRNS